jgi:arylsulfatase A-like enzyme
VADRPNILYLHSHDTGRYIQPYGHAVRTPHMQGLADQGVLFRNCFCANPTCSPSRASLLTGMVPHSNGMTGLAHRGWRLNDYSHHILHTLRRVGYTSALFGTQHIVSHDQVDQIGYDVAMPGGTTEERTQAAVSFLSTSPPQPFFVSVGYFETHRPFHVAQPGIGGYAEDERFVRPPPSIPDTLETRRDMAGFNASVRVLDHCYGQVLQALVDADLAGKTLVICTTDHGIAFPGMKCTLTDHGIGVLLIMRGPRGFSGGVAVDALVSHLDLFPTICDYLAIQPPPWLQGTSFLSPWERLSEGLGEALRERHTIREEVYAEVNYHAAYEPQRCVRTQRHKYIRRFDNRKTVVLANCDDSLSKEVWLRAGWRTRARQQELLFDLTLDPNEAHNLAQDPDYQDVLQEMRARLIRWMEQTGDPLLAGPVPAPEGAVVNDPDAVSPLEPTRPAHHSPNGGDVRE